MPRDCEAIEKLMESSTMLKTEPMILFGRKDSLEDAIEYIDAQLPITDSNKLHALLMMYHNTLLHVQTVNRSHREYPHSNRQHCCSYPEVIKGAYT